MKRSGFKKKSFSEYKPMKRTQLKKVSTLKRSPIKKVSKQPISKIKKKLWELCKQLIREKYGNTCYTCGKSGLSGSNWHTGHFIPDASSGAYIRYDLRNLRPQCYHCNINMGGAGAMFYRKMVEVEGKKYVDKLFEDKNKIVKAYDHYLELIDTYTNMLSIQK